MGNFTYENQGASTWLVYTLSEEEAIDSMSLGMITNNVIPGLCNTVFMQKNADRHIKYNISSRIPVSQFFSGPVNRKKLLDVFDGVIRAVMAAEEYMIDVDMILLDLNYIYADVSTYDTVLICLPVAESAQQKNDISMFFKEIMFSTLFDSTENCDHVTKIINYLNSAYNFSLADFQSLIRELGAEGQAVSAPAGKSGGTIFRSSGADSVPIPPPDPAPHPVPVPPVSPYPDLMPVSLCPGGGDADRSVPQPPVPQPVIKKEKGMSLFYLLQHYNKENAGIYKAQKEEKKQQKESRKKEKKEKPEKGKKEKQKKGSGFAIPGQIVPPIPPKAPVASVPPVPPAASVPLAGPVPGGEAMGAGPVSPAAPGPSFVPPADRAGNTGADFGTTVIIGQEPEDSSTTVIMGVGANAELPICPHLIRRKNNERILIQQDVFRLGRNADFNDYVIIGNEFVGNTHCHILVKGGEYFIVDDNSKNHTFVGGVMVMPGTEVKLTHGQTVTLADEEFEFRLF